MREYTYLPRPLTEANDKLIYEAKSGNPFVAFGARIVLFSMAPEIIFEEAR